MFSILLLDLFPLLILSAGIKEYSVEYLIQENEIIGKMVGTISSDIQGAGFSSKNIFEVKYRTGAETCCFKLNENTGVLSTSSSIDLEELCGDATLKIDCSSGQGRLEMIVNLWHNVQLLSVVRVRISVLDVNDNVPRFSDRTIKREVSEASHKAGQSIFLEGASDPDISPDNSQIEYGLADYTYVFQLNKDALREPYLLLLKDLDAEEQTHYQLKLKAWNPQNYKVYSELQIDIIVLDFNDNPPRFNDTKISVLVKEKAAPGSIIFQLGATDPDKSSVLRFSIDPTSNMEIRKTFTVLTNGSVVLKAKGLDYERHHNYQVPVCVSDGLYDSRAVLEVLIEDENDEFPQFLQNPSTIAVTENNNRDLSIGQVIVTDKDSAYINGRIICQHNASMVGFSLNLSTKRHPTDLVFDIRTDRTFDREKSSVFHMKLICSDGWDTNTIIHLTSTFTVTVHIIDVNDNSPQFKQVDYNTNVMENSPSGTAVVQVLASDVDVANNGEFIYSLEDSNVPFSIDSSTGWVVVRGQLDREQKDSYQFVILAADKGVPSLTGRTSVKVMIDDDNDHDPKLMQPYEYVVQENEAPHSIGTLNVEDLDIGRNAEVTFVQLWGGGDTIIILTNGTIFVNTSLNREEKGRICLRLRLYDNGTTRRRQSSGEVCIRVLDINDNSPIFVQPRGLIADGQSVTSKPNQPVPLSIYESPGHVITQLVASDADELENARITYHVEYPKTLYPSMLLLNSTSGYITLNTTLSHRHIGLHQLKVIATDSGKPPLSDIKVLLINVVNEAPRGNKHQSFENDAYWMKRNNVIVVLILTSITITFIVMLVTAIVCMMKPTCQRTQGSNHWVDNGSDERPGSVKPFKTEDIYIDALRENLLITGNDGHGPWLHDRVETISQCATNHSNQLYNENVYGGYGSFIQSYPPFQGQRDHYVLDDRYLPMTLSPGLQYCTLGHTRHTTTEDELKEDVHSDSGRGASEDDIMRTYLNRQKYDGLAETSFDKHKRQVLTSIVCSGINTTPLYNYVNGSTTRASVDRDNEHIFNEINNLYFPDRI